MPNIIIVIPTFNPTSLMIDAIADLNKLDSLNRLVKIIVNDGSDQGLVILDQAKRDPNVIVLNHEVNKGKGAAIKTALNYIIHQMPSAEYALTLDSDNQHKSSDVAAIVNSIVTTNPGLHVGVRKLNKEKTPWRSYWGNLISRKIFSFLFRYELWDTQSGLRAYPRTCFETLIGLRSNRYEFEMEAIIISIKNKIQIYETPIETVYINRNVSSHFRPFVDSYRVIRLMLKMKFWN